MRTFRATAVVCVGLGLVNSPALGQDCKVGGAPALHVHGSFEGGQTVTFRAVGVDPGVPVHFVRSQDGSENACPGFMQGDCLDIGGNLLMASPIADSAGEAELQVTLPSTVTTGLQTAVQAAAQSCGTPQQTEVVALVAGEPVPDSGALDDGPVCSFGQGAWGQTCRGNNMGCTRDAGFDLAFPDGLLVGGPTPLFFTHSDEVRDFLPAGGPLHRSPDSAFYGQLVSLVLNVGFNDAGLFGPGSDLRNAVVDEGAYAGQTVGQVLAAAESAELADVTDDLMDAVEAINEGFAGCDLNGGIVLPPVDPDTCGDGIVDIDEVCDGGVGCDDTCHSTLTEVELGRSHGCGVDDMGDLLCWGDDSDGQLAVSAAGPWVQVSAGGFHTCALDAFEEVACWGQDAYGQTSGVPSEAFVEVSSGNHHTCALTVAGEIRCWGKDDYGQVSGAPSGSYDGISAGNQHTCAWSHGGTAVCWGRNNFGQVSAPKGHYAQVVAGSNFSCGIDLQGTATCWGSDLVGRSTPPADPFAAIGLGANFGCGLGTDGSVTCWGSTYNNRSAAPAGTFTGLSVGDYSSCAWNADEVTCWGDLDDGPLQPW